MMASLLASRQTCSSWAGLEEAASSDAAAAAAIVEEEGGKAEVEAEGEMTDSAYDKYVSTGSVRESCSIIRNRSQTGGDLQNCKLLKYPAVEDVLQSAAD